MPHRKRVRRACFTKQKIRAKHVQGILLPPLFFFFFFENTVPPL